MGTREDLNSTNSSGHNEEQYSIIRNREVLKDSGYRSATGGPPGMPSYGCYSSDDYYGVQSDSDIIINERYKNDAKLRKRCAVVITPTEELIQYERKRDQMYNEILQKQRRKLELRALEKQREKERRRLGRREEKRDKNTVKGTTATTTAVAVERDRDKIPRRRGKNYNEIFMSSESEFETNFQVRTRKQRQQNVKELQQPLNIQVEMTDVTSSLLSQIEAHLDKPETKKTEMQQQKEKESRLEQQPNNNTENDINQQQCDITDKSQQTKMRELNLLADIAQHLSPYQLDLPENNNTNINNPSTTPLPAQPQTQAVAETPPTQNTIKAKEKITVTEHLIIIQSLDNLLEKPQTQLVTKEHEQEHEHDQKQEDQQLMATPSYAHEPKLNIAAILNSSPNRTQNQENNTPTKENDNSLDDEHNTDQILKANIPSDDALEQILEESISVLKSVTSPYNPLNECTPQTPAETTIPLLISNVESLNNFQHESTEATNKKSSQDKEHLIENERERKANNENVILRENGKESNEKSKDVAEEQNKNLTSSLLNTVDSSIMCSTDLSNISVETEITNALKVPPLMPADLSDISLESEISKHLPDIAEPSPVVTDMSDNSNASDVSKAFSLDTRQPMINNSTQNANDVTVMSLPVLPLVMPNMPSTPTTLSTTGEQHGTALESNFGPLNSTLNTPTKLAVLNREEELRNSHLSNDLNTPLKFPIQPAELSGDNMPLKNTLEPEADNNVTKFLDLILNKTVTDAESETRDKIIKELNALTADSTAAITETQGTGNKNEITENLECENDKNKQLGITEAIMENSNSNEEKATKNINVIKEQGNLELECLKPQETVLYFSSEKDKTSTENIELAKRHEHEGSSLQEPLANNEVNPPKENVEELQTEEITDSELTSSTTPSEVKSLTSATKMKTAIKQTFNIKCRVRLKRLNIDDHYKSSRKETWMAIPLAKPEEKELNTNVENMTNCDILTESTTSLMKKPCLKYNNNNNKRSGEEMDIKGNENDIEAIDKDLDTDETAAKKLKLEDEQNSTTSTAIQTSTLSQPIQTQMPILEASQATPTLLFNTTTNSSSTTTTTSNTPTSSKSKTKPLKTVTFDLSNLNEELRDSSTFGHKKSSKNHAATIAGGAMGCYLKNSRPPRKLPDNTLRAAETLQIFVNTLNDSTRTPPPAEFNKKRSPIKNKCIAEDETPRPPPAATLMGTPPCKKNCTEKSRSQISSSKCKDQLVSSLATPTISTITSDITTARIYTSSPLDQTLPEYDDNVDTVADSELILPTTTGSLRRKLKRPKKSLTRPEPADDISTDDISNQPECNGEDDTDAVVDNEDDVFAEELLPIPAANEHILEEIVSARPSHMGSGTVIRDDYMNIEATATVPVYLFNDESRDLATPEPIQSSDTTNVVDSSSYLNTSSNSITNTVVAAAATTASTSSTMGSLEKSMLSPSEHEVSSTQETFYQTPTKSKQNETFGDKSSSNKDKSASGSSSLSASQKLKAEENNFQNKEDDQTSSTTGLLQNNQVDTTNHSPEMCTLTLTPTTTTTTSSTTAMTSNRKIRKASTHDEILFNELQQQQQQQQQQLPTNKRKTNLTTTTSCAESTSDHNSNSNTSKMKIITNNLEEHSKSNGSLAKVEDKFKKLLKEVCKRDKNQSSNEINITDIAGGNIGSGSGGGGGGGSSPSTTTTINEEKLSRSKRKKQKSSKSSKTKNHTERSTKIVLKASKLAAHIPASNPLIITIPKSRLLRPPPTPTPPTPTESQQDIFQQQENEFLNIPNAKLFIEKEKETTTTTTTMAMAMTTTPLPPSAIKNNNHHQQQHHNHQHHTKHNATTHINKIEHTPVAVVGKSSKRTLSPAPTITDNVNTKYNINSETFKLENSINTNSAIPASKEKSFSSTLTSKKKPKTSSNSSSTNTATCGTTNSINSNKNSNSNLVFVKDKYDLIKSKDKYHHNHHYSELIEQNKEKKDKTSSYSSQSLKATTSSSSANTRLHKSSSKEKVKGEKVKEKHKTTEKELAVKLNTTESSINKTLNTLSSSNSKQSNSSKSNKNSSSSNFSHSTSASNAAILKSKTNINNSSTLLSAANIQQINNSASSTSTSISASASSSPSVTISNNHHVRKKLKTK